MNNAVMISSAFSESKPISVTEHHPPPGTNNYLAPPPESELVECDCCQLAEECTPGYIESVREQHCGWWICGLCADAVAYEMLRSDGDIEVDEALMRHMKLCEQFRSSPLNPAEKLISAVKHLLKRTLSAPIMKLDAAADSDTSDATEGKNSDE